MIVIWENSSAIANKVADIRTKTAYLDIERDGVSTN